MKLNLFSLAFVLIVAACAALTAKPTSPCKGQYCIEVSLPGIPGSPELCYKTPDELTAAKVYWQAKGYAVTSSHVQGR